MSRAKKVAAARRRSARVAQVQPEKAVIVVSKGGNPVVPTEELDATKLTGEQLVFAMQTAIQHHASDFDEDFKALAEPKYIPFDMFAPKQADPITGEQVDWEIRASLFEVSRDGKSYRINKLPNKKALQERLTESTQRWGKLQEAGQTIYIQPSYRLREAQPERDAAIEYAARLMESQMLREDGFAQGGWGDATGAGQYGSSLQGTGTAGYGSFLDVDAEYIPIMGGPESKQLYMYQYLDMHRKSFEAYNHNPIAHQLCELQTAFVLGRGIDHSCTNQDVEAVWKEFVDRTDFYNDLENIATDFWWAGETMLEFYDNVPSKGLTDYRMIDPSTVWDVITDPEDIQKIYYYHQQYSTPYQMYTTGKIPTMQYILRDIPANNVLHVKLNASKYEKRGRTDLFSILGWLKRLKDLMNARVVKGQLEAAFVWDVTVNSGEADVSKTSLNLPDPYKAGSTFVHNKNLTLAPVTSSIKGSEAAPDIAALLNIIAVGFGIPKDFIGEASKGAKAGALTATEPGVKRFERRQRLIENFCYRVANRVISNAVKAKQLDIEPALEDAKSVTKLGRTGDNLPNRTDIQGAMEDTQQQANDKAQKVTDQQNKMAVQAHKVGVAMAVKDQDHQHKVATTTMNQQHKQTMAALDKPGQTNVQMAMPGTQGPTGGSVAQPGGMAPAGQQGPPGAQGAPPQGNQGQPPQGAQQPMRQSARESLSEAALRTGGKTPNNGSADSESGSGDAGSFGPKGGTEGSIATGNEGIGEPVTGENSGDTPDLTDASFKPVDPNAPKELNSQQKKRITAIKDAGQYGREFLEFIFPSIAQEDRSAKLKDLALAESMQWLSKSTAAKLAGKELGITTYQFADEWAQIGEEAQMGMSIAHVYTQDNEHVPQTTIAQDIQAELAAKQPIAPQNQQVNVPVPPAVAGDKLMPAAPPGGGPGGPPKPGGAGTGAQSNPSAAPGKASNSGISKVNQSSPTSGPNPVAGSHGYSAAANNPMGAEGAAKAKESLSMSIKRKLLQEALGPSMRSVRALTDRILEVNEEADELLSDGD